MFSVYYLLFCPSLLLHLDTLNPCCLSISVSDYTVVYRHGVQTQCQNKTPHLVLTIFCWQWIVLQCGDGGGHPRREWKTTSEGAGEERPGEGAVSCAAALPHYANPPKESLHRTRTCVSLTRLWWTCSRNKPTGGLCVWERLLNIYMLFVSFSLVHHSWRKSCLSDLTAFGAFLKVTELNVKLLWIQGVWWTGVSSGPMSGRHVLIIRTSWRRFCF